MDSGSLGLNLCIVPIVEVRVAELEELYMVQCLGSGGLGQSGQECKLGELMAWPGQGFGMTR